MESEECRMAGPLLLNIH